MQPLGHSSNGSLIGKCQETGSKCVIWDGPDINCLGVNLCKGQSIEVIMYHTAVRLCEVLEALNISPVDLACLTPPAGAALPDSPNQLFQLIIDKLCEINQDVIDLQGTTSVPVLVPLPDCNQLFANCPPGTTLQYVDPNTGATVTQLVLIDPTTNTSPAVVYLASVICDLLCRMTTVEDQIIAIQSQINTILNSISGALPSVDVPACISPVGTLPIADPNDPASGAVYEIGQVLCQVIDQITDDPVGGNYPLETSCNNVDIATLPAYGTYPPPLVVNTLQDLGAIPNADKLWQVVNNMMVAICDLRDFADNVKNNCCPQLCTLIAPTPSAAGIGAVISQAGRGKVKFFLNGTYLDVSNNTNVTANFNFAGFLPPLGPGFAVNGPTLNPPKWDIQYPVNITITDGNVPPNVFTNNAFTLDQFAASGYNQEFDLAPLGFNTTTDYTVTYSVTVAAPDGTFCTYSDTQLLTTSCTNSAVTNVTVSDIGGSGFTLNFNTPVPITPPTILQNYRIEILPVGGGSTITLTAPAGWNQYYIYPSEIDYPGANPPASGNQWIFTSAIQPNSQYDVTVTAIYNCGESVPVGQGGGAFTTLVNMVIDISSLTAGVECLTPGVTGQLQLNGPLGVVSGNFNMPIIFDGKTPKTITVAAPVGTVFTYSFNTLSLNGGPWTLNNPGGANCAGPSGTTRCWGQWPTANYYPGNTIGDTFSQLINQYQQAGCYDYITAQFSASNGLTLGTAAPLVTNINDGSGPGSTNTNHGTYSYSYNAPAGALTMPTTNCNLAIINNAHPINNALSPVITIVIQDPFSYLANKSVMWYGLGTANAGPGVIQSSAAVEHNSIVQSFVTSPVSKWFSTTGTNGVPVGLPVFMRIAVWKWNGSTYAPPLYPTATQPAGINIIDVTPYWLSLPGITTPGTGFQINIPNRQFNIGLKDLIKITFTGGIDNTITAPNPNYAPTGPGPGAAAVVPSTVTIDQDPFSGIFPDPTLVTGPFSATGQSPTIANAAFGISHTLATAGYTWSPGDGRCGVPLNDSGLIPGNPPAPTARRLAYTQLCDFIISGNTTITWTVG